MSLDITALPSELLVAPQPLVGLCGLDVSRNAVHKSIWDAFSSNRKPDRAAVQYKLLPANYEFPVAKPKRASYEWYQPKGILKRNWMLKHLHVLPAVVVLVQELEWNDMQWTEKQLQCASAMQSLKNALQERNTRLCLVMLQKSAPLPPGEDLLASERASSLTAACGINSKMLFVLPHTEHLMGYTLRLESAFLDMAQSYYALMSKRIRTHRDQLTAMHTTLKIRHQFKLGFVAEIRQDFSTALKHYTQAYSNIDEIKLNDAICLEMKTIAGFLNYKICRLMFKLKVARDAINHFISHIEKYKNRVGFKELVFEHYAWLSTQHSIFAELFCEAIKNGLDALQTQHPGIYFHKAAEYTIKRKEAFQQCSAISLSPTESTTPTSLQNNNAMGLYTEFFGVRASKSGESMSEKQLNNLIRENEKSYNHSSAIITLLGQAMAQFKLYKCLRFRKKLAVDMADEYFKSGDHSKALTLYSLMLPDYRQDKWSSIFSDVLVKTLRCSLLSASLADYISCSLEALSLKIRYTQEERIIVLENLWKVFQGVPPVSQCQNAPEVREGWENALACVKSPIYINSDKLIEILELCATFESVEVKADDTIRVHLIVKLLTDVPIKVRSFAVLLTDGTSIYKLQAVKHRRFSNLLEVRPSSQNLDSSALTFSAFESDLKLEPDVFYQFLFTTEAQQFLENTQLRVISIETQMGTDKLSTLLTRSAAYTRNPFRHHNRCKDLDDNIAINSVCYIAPTFHLVTQTSLGNETMLVNEYYAVTTVVNNPYNVFLQNVGLNVRVPAHLRNKVFLTTDISPSRQKLHTQISIDIGEFSMQGSNTASFYILSLIETNITLIQKIWYTMDVVKTKASSSILVSDHTFPDSTDNSPDNVRSIVSAANAEMLLTPAVQLEFLEENRLKKIREDRLNIKCGLEFKFAGRFYTLNKRPLTKIYRGENFLFRVNMEVQAESDIDILESYFICDHNLVQTTYSFKRKKFTNTYCKGDKLEDVMVLRTNADLHDWISSKDYERIKLEPQTSIFNRAFQIRTHNLLRNVNASVTPSEMATPSATLNKNLMAKIPTNMTIISNSSGSPNALMVGSQTSNMSSSSMSDDSGGKTTPALQISQGVDPGEQLEVAATSLQKTPSMRLVFNKAIEAIQVTGHCRGFIKGIVTVEQEEQTQQTVQQQQQQQFHPVFGVYCIKWRRHGSKEENESKFIVNGLDIENPPLNIYCTLEEKVFVKMPMTFKVLLKNPSAKVLHLITTLSTSNTDNFICSGHKQLDISIFAFGEKALVYNLYPLCVGWQNLPELTLEYNTQADPSKNESQNNLLNELVLRSMPKRVFVLPPLKQHSKAN